MRRPSCSAVFLQTTHWRCGFFLLTHRDVTYWGKWRPIRRCGESALLGRPFPVRAASDDGNSIDCSRNIPISAIETVFLTNYTSTSELNRLMLEIVYLRSLILRPEELLKITCCSWYLRILPSFHNAWKKGFLSKAQEFLDWRTQKWYYSSKPEINFLYT